MKKTIRFIAVVIVALGMANSASAQDVGLASAEAFIVAPLAITWQQDMDFGNIGVVGAAAGTVVMTTTGDRTGYLGAMPIEPVNGDPTPAIFTITGEADAQIMITLPASCTVYEVGGDDMLVDSFVSVPPAGLYTMATATVVLNIGATIHVAGDQTIGQYITASDFQVSVNYQ